MLKLLSRAGIRSEHLYAAGVASIGLTFLTWSMSRFGENAGTARADRWGIFVGEWAPTFLALGTALKLEESDTGSE